MKKILHAMSLVCLKALANDLARFIQVNFLDGFTFHEECG